MMSTRPATRFYPGWGVVAGAFFGMAAFSVSRHLYPYVLPTMEAELGLPHERMGNIASAYFVAYTIMTLVWGMVADRIGSRKPMLMGMLIISAGLFSMGFMTSFPQGLSLYLLCGAGAAGLSIPQVPLISRWFGQERRGMALGLAMTGAGAATVGLGLMTPWILAAYSWRWAWWASAASVLAMAVVASFLLVESPAQKGLSSGAGVEQAGERPASLAWASLVGLLRRGTVWNLAGVYATWGLGYVIFMTFAVAYLEEIGWTPRAAAAVFATSGGLSVLGPPTWGALADRLAKKYVLALVLALQCAGLVGLINGSTAGAYVGAAAFGLGLAGVPAVMSASMGDYFEPAVMGSIFGFITLVFGVGCIVGPTVGGFLGDQAGTLQAALLFALGAIALSLGGALVLRKPS